MDWLHEDELYGIIRTIQDGEPYEFIAQVVPERGVFMLHTPTRKTTAVIELVRPKPEKKKRKKKTKRGRRGRKKK